MANIVDAQTINELLEHRVGSSAEMPALFYSNDCDWEALSWSDYARKIDLVSSSLLAHGLEHGDRVAIIGRNTFEWFATDMGIMCAGLVSVPIYETSSSDQILYILQHSSAKILFVENSDYLDRVLSIAQQAASLECIVVSYGDACAHPLVQPLKVFTSKNKTDDVALLKEARKKINGATTATFIYTSGTTGQPKAVILSHLNTVSAAQNVQLSLASQWQGRDKISCSYLPLSHVAERVCSLFAPLLDGRKVYIVSDMTRVMDAVKQVRPTIWLGVPRIWEKIFEAVNARSKELSGYKKAVYQWSMRVGLRYNCALQEGMPVSASLNWQYKMAYKIVIAPLLASLGLDRVVISITGGAPSRPEIGLFFSSIGLWLQEVYGQTEGYGTTSLSSRSHYKAGSCGKPFPLVEVRIADDGEILVRGNNVSPGYYNDPSSSESTFKDGWLYSGDIGFLDDEGNLWVTGRKKDIIITSGGKNITPSKIEHYLCESDLISHAVVVGDGQKYLTALLDLNAEKVDSYFAKSDSPGERDAQVGSAIALHIKQANSKLSRVEQVKKYRIFYDEFTSQNGLLTNTMKLKRQAVLKRYEDQIDLMYAEE